MRLTLSSDRGARRQDSMVAFLWGLTECALRWNTPRSSANKHIESDPGPYGGWYHAIRVPFTKPVDLPSTLRPFRSEEGSR